MSNARLNQAYRKSASNLHQAVGEILRNSIAFKFAKVYQEYPVNRISRYFDSGREKFDWVILDPFKAIIECHGQQHYKPVRFGGITEEEAQENYKEQVQRDLKKKKAAEEAGYKYVIIKYDEKPTEEIILRRITEYELPIGSGGYASPQSPNKKWYQRAKAKYTKWIQSTGIPDKQREYRKTQYERAKAYKLTQKNKRSRG